MKVAVITLKDSPNYGGILQAYALQEAIKKLGHECDLIDYMTDDFRKKFTFFGKPPRMKMIYWIYKKVQYPIMVCMMKKMMPFYDHMSLTRHFSLKDELKELNKKYDAFVTGSDQVWACDLNCYDDSYFMSFANPDKLKFSYAASFGRTLEMMTEDEKSFISKQKIDFKCISVREASSVKICSSLWNRQDAQPVLDPTLLLDKDDWSKVSVKPSKQKYVLCYLMQSRTNDTEALKFAKRIAKEKGLKLVKICRGLTSLLWGETLYVPTCEEWLGLFMNADYIVTNSFHGVAFSVNFNRNFTAFVEGELEEGRNSRLFNISSALGLKSRIKQVGKSQEIDSSDIDYTIVNTKLESLRNRSIDFLFKALS